MHNDRFTSYRETCGFERSAEKAISNGMLSESEQKMIADYLTYLEGNKGVSAGTARTAGTNLVAIKFFIKTPYNSLTADDITAFKVAMGKKAAMGGKKLSVNTQSEYLRRLKAFARYLIKKGKITTLTNADLDDISNIRQDYRTESEHDLITPDDLAAMIRACTNDRDRALLYMLYETGARAGEIARLTWGDLTFNQGMIKVKIDDEKTQKERNAYVINGLTYLTNLKNSMGGQFDKKLFVFTARDRPLTYDYMNMRIRIIAKKAGITKRVHIHLFRKSWISHMVDDGYSDGLIREMFWNNQGTEQYKRYVQKSGKKSETEMMIRAGLVTPDNKPVQTRCICGEIHGPEILFCPKTGAPVNKQAATVDNDIMATIAALKAEIVELKKARGN